jgi:tetratricopeptide (TPR) repeat protein
MEETSPAPTYRCDRCHVESTVKEAFLQKTDAKGKVRSSLCLECKTKKDAQSLLSLYLILPVIGILLSLTPGYTGLGVFYIQMFAGLLLTIPLILLHELSHAGVGRLLGLHVFAIHLGAGTVIYTGRWWGLRWYIKPFPLLGLTIVAGPEMSRMRLRIFLLHLAGPGLHAVLIGLLGLVLWALPPLPPDSIALQAIWILICTNFFLLVTNLYPRKITAGQATTGTDGWAMFNAFRLTPQELQKRYAMFYILQAVDAVDCGDNPAARQWAEQGLGRYPRQPMMINALGYVYSHLGEYARARETFLNVLACAEKPPESVKFMALNNVAFADLMLEDPALLEQADEYSQQAYKNYPWEPAVGGTRGAVLVALGRVAEGLALLKSAMARNPDKRGKALDACLIASGEMKRRDLREAQKYLSAAMDLDPQCELLERTRREWLALQG